MSNEPPVTPVTPVTPAAMPVDVLQKEYAEAKADMLKYKQQAREATEQIQKLTENINSTKESELAEQQKFKELAEQRAKALEEANSKYQSLEQEVQKQKLNIAVADELQKRGIKADPSWVGVDSMDGIAEAIEAFEKDYPHLKTQTIPSADNRKPPIHTSERWWMKPNLTDDEFGKMTGDQYAERKRAYPTGGSAFGG